MYTDFMLGTGSLAQRTRRLDYANIGILADYTRIPYAAGSTFATQLLHTEFKRRGHEVTVVGPRAPDAEPGELPSNYVLFAGVPVRSQPGFYLPLPTIGGLKALANRRLQMLVGQTGSSLMEAGVWLRLTQNVPLVCVNTTMLSQVYDVMLPEVLSKNAAMQSFCRRVIVPILERASVATYNQADGLVVLSKGLERYWRNLGVKVPIHVIPRSVDPRVARGFVGRDPFDPRAERGKRIIVLCRHVREKGLARLIDIFAKHVAPKVAGATLTMVGDGADHDSFRSRVERLGLSDRVFFPGEFPVTEVRNWYAHADVFAYTSLSETYGQVVSEAMWSGLPVVAFDDDAGVAQQIRHMKDSLLLPPGPDADVADAQFGLEVVDLLRRPERRAELAEAARRSASSRIEPDACIDRYYQAFDSARMHRDRSPSDVGLVKRVIPIVRWATMHSAAALLTRLRPAATLNRHGRRQPGWGDAEIEIETATAQDTLSSGVAA
ncbi:MAG: glycosyltransferase [Deltaproteobacteria bacterium]|nr:glycosyltransferase [Deltaproteobacteria bacterium]